MKNIFLTLLIVLVTSCGESPILNHKTEKNFSLVKDTSFSQIDEFKFKNSGFSFSVDWESPPHVGETKFVLKMWKSDSGTFNGPYKDSPHSMHVFLWMPSMGHGSSPVKLTKKAPGEYEVTNVFFIMGGNWEVKFQLLSGNKVVDETILPFTI